MIKYYDSNKIDDFISCDPKKLLCFLYEFITYDDSVLLKTTIYNKWDKLTLWEKQAVLFKAANIVHKLIIDKAKEIVKEARIKEPI